ncbi:hypothetical protein Tco_1418375 [Tanacetum coccineum]
MLKVAKFSEEPEQSLLPPFGEVNADDTADKSLSRAFHAEVTVATADATKSLEASELAEEQGNRPSTAETVKVLDQNAKEDKDDEFINSDDAQEYDVSKSDNILQDDHASAEHLILLDHMDHICEESSLPELITDSLKDQLPRFLSDALKDTLPQLLRDSIKSSVSKSIIEELPHVKAQRFALLQKELSKSFHKNMKKSIRLKVRKGMKEVQDKLSCCTSTVATNSQHVQDLRVMFKDMVSLLEGEQPSTQVGLNDEKALVVRNPEEKKEGTLSMEDDSDKGILSLEEYNNQIRELKRISDLKAQQDKSEQELKKMFSRATLMARAKKWTEHEVKKAKIVEEYNHQISFKANPLPITKISYVVNSNKEATMKITKGDNPLNLIVHPNLRLKSLGFSEWLEVHALLRKKRKRTQFLKEAFVTEDIRVNGMNRNLIPPHGVVPIKGLIIKEPESGIFFMNKNTDIAFQRESEFHLTPTIQLIRIQNQIKVDSKIVDEMFRKMIYVIKARSDCIKARGTVMKGLSECKALESNIRRIRVKDIIKEVKDYLKTYSLAGMDISWRLLLCRTYTVDL